MIKKLPIYLFAFVIVVLLTIFINSMILEKDQSAQIKENIVILAGQKISVELADTGAKRAQGLSGRDPLPAGTGMLFIFDQPGVYPFWMNQMKFALDIIWIDKGKIVDIWANAPPPLAGQAIPRYSPKAEALYVLEVNAEFVAEESLKIGDIVTIDLN